MEHYKSEDNQVQFSYELAEDRLEIFDLGKEVGIEISVHEFIEFLTRSNFLKTRGYQLIPDNTIYEEI